MPRWTRSYCQRAKPICRSSRSRSLASSTSSGAKRPTKRTSNCERRARYSGSFSRPIITSSTTRKEPEYRALLSQFDVRLVGLFAPLDVLEAREREREDRQIGLARWQYDRVHRGIGYDLEIDTTTTTPLENARRICAAFGL